MRRCSEGSTDNECEIDAYPWPGYESDTDAWPNYESDPDADFYTDAVAHSATGSDTDDLSFAVALTFRITYTGSDAQVISGTEPFSRRLVHSNACTGRLPGCPKGLFGKRNCV